MTTIKVQERGVITLPKKIRDEVGIDRDTLIDIETRDGSVIMRPVSRLHPDLLADLKSALEDLRMGNVSPPFRSGAELETYMAAKRKRNRSRR